MYLTVLEANIISDIKVGGRWWEVVSLYGRKPWKQYLYSENNKPCWSFGNYWILILVFVLYFWGLTRKNHLHTTQFQWIITILVLFHTRSIVTKKIINSCNSCTGICVGACKMLNAFCREQVLHGQYMLDGMK